MPRVQLVRPGCVPPVAAVEPLTRPAAMPGENGPTDPPPLGLPLRFCDYRSRRAARSSTAIYRPPRPTSPPSRTVKPRGPVIHVPPGSESPPRRFAPPSHLDRKPDEDAARHIDPSHCGSERFDLPFPVPMIERKGGLAGRNVSQPPSARSFPSPSAATKHPFSNHTEYRGDVRRVTAY